MKATKRTTCLLVGSALALAAMVPIAASAHTHVFLGINLGGRSAPPVEVYASPAYRAPPPGYYAPPPVYYYRHAYYVPRVVYTEPYPNDYHCWDHHWRRGRYHHGDRDWRQRWEHHDDDDDR